LKSSLGFAVSSVFQVCPCEPYRLKKIRVTDGIGNKSGSGSFVDLFGGSALRDLTFFYNGYPITHIEGFLLIVGQVNEPCTQAAMDVFYFDMHLATKLKVKGAQGFVKQNHIGLKDQSPSECDPLCCWPPLSCFGYRFPRPS
jgi:hypothetical protein